jgi:mono/diheme cytochrome c family protein
MPPQRNLSDEEIAQVLTYVRNAWGNAAYPVTPSQAVDLRIETAARERPWTDAELEATVH